MDNMFMVQGDAATCIMKKLHDSHVAREQAKTKQQLDDITSRINNTLQDYDDTTKLLETSGSNMEIVADLQELEALLKDDILKTKYQQKLTIFIVGYQSLCSERVDLLSQLSEFFSTYSVPSLTGDETTLSLSDNHVEALSCSVEEALLSMSETVNRLNEISSEVIGYMDHLHVAASSKNTKSKKKLERALHNAKDEILKMTNKVLQFQQDLGMKDERLQQLTSQVDAKKVEITHLKRQQDMTKKTYEKLQDDLKQERNGLQLEVEGLEMDIKMLKNQLREAESTSASLKAVNPKVQEIKDTALVELERLKTKMEAEELDIPEVKRELAEQFQVQLQQMSDVYDEEIDMWMQECRVHVHDILEVELSEDEAQQWTQARVGRSITGSALSNKDKPISPYHTSSVVSDVKPSTAESEVRPTNEKSDADTDLMDEEFWKNLPPEQLQDKFEEFRSKARKELARLTENLHSANMVRENLANEATKWMEERASLLSHIEQLKALQEAAEADAEEAMRNLEEFAAEQEQLEASQYRSRMGTGAGDASTVQEGEMLTEDNVQSMDAAFRGNDSSPSSVSKPASEATSRLASAYKQKIAERREAIQQRKKERLRSESSVASPQFKGMFDTGLLEEFLQCYRSVVEFKDMISQEMSRHSSHHSRAHAINAVQTSSYDASNDEVHLYVNNMTSSVEQSLKVIQENVAAALATQGSSDADTQRQRASKLQDELNDMRNEYEKRAQHDSAMIMHLQNTLSETQRGNTAAIGTSGSGFPSSPAGPIIGKTPSSSQRNFTGDSNITVLFSRHDAEHNAKALKKSAAIGRITQETLESVVMTMEAYNAIPAKRIQHLASKVMHHTKMKVIETNVRNSNLVTSEVFAILEKMETLQRHRAQTWSRQMDELTSERRRLAALLSDALQKLECITGVFLIKPVVSYRGKNSSKRYSGKISTRFNKYQVEAMLQKMQMRKSTLAQIPHHAIQVKIGKSSAFNEDRRPKLSSIGNTHNYQRQNTEPLTVSGMVRQGEGNMPMWNVKASQTRSAPVAQQHKDDLRIGVTIQHPLTVPKLLELDVNRYQINSSKVHAIIDDTALQGLGDDRLRNMDLMSLRGHANVPRSGTHLPRKAEVQSGDSRLSNQSVGFKSSAPPTTPALFKLEVELKSENDSNDDDEEMPQPIRVITSPIPKPLPPIKTSSTRSSVSPRSPIRDVTPRSTTLTPSRSMPDMSATVDQASNVSSPPFSARKDMGTSPVAEA